MKNLLAWLMIILSMPVAATGLADLQFGKYQIADTQWNVSACMYTASCQIYSKNPGVAYKVPWYAGQISWASGDYIKFEPNMVNGVQDATNPWLAKQYTSSNVYKATMGTGHIINMGTDFFFFVGNDNNTGQLFSMTSGMSGSSGITWTGTLNPTVAQVNTLAGQYGSTTPLAQGQTYTAAPAAPSLCCGGSAASFNADATNVAKVQTFTSRTTQDSQVYIEQVGNQNSIVVNQSGTKNNYAHYSGNGSNDIVSITQSGNNSTQVNYADLTITGDTNTAILLQQSTGGAKGVFATVIDDNNSLIVTQKDSGSHYAEINLSGGNKNVDITQQGSASHIASISLSGLPVDLSLSQSGSAQQFYSIQFNCATTGGCPKITVTQGN